jgi:hypothetical protein
VTQVRAHAYQLKALSSIASQKKNDIYQEKQLNGYTFDKKKVTWRAFV